jgi:hypothetical protein
MVRYCDFASERGPQAWGGAHAHRNLFRRHRGSAPDPIETGGPARFYGSGLGVEAGRPTAPKLATASMISPKTASRIPILKRLRRRCAVDEGRGPGPR